MHKLLLAFSLLLATLPGIAKDDIQLSGQILHPTARYVQISRFSGLLLLDAKRDSVKLDDQGRFSFTLPWPQAREATFSTGQYNIHLYLNPGDRLVLTADAKDFNKTIKYTGTGSTINSYMARQTVAQKNKYMAQTHQNLVQPNQLIPEAGFIRKTDSFRTAEMKQLEQHFNDPVFELTKAERAFMEKRKNDITYEWADQYVSHAVWGKKSGSLSEQYHNFRKQLPITDQEVYTSPFMLFSLHYSDYLAKEAVKKQPALSNQNENLLRYQQLEKEYTGQARRVALAWLLNEMLMLESDLAPMKPAYERFLKEPGLEPEIRDNIASIWTASEKLAEGSPAPDFTALTPDGKAVKLSDFKGKVVLLSFWGANCFPMPCDQTLASVTELETAFHGKDVVFLNINLDENKDLWQKSLEKHRFPGTNIRAEKTNGTGISDLYAVPGYPNLVVVDRKGNIFSRSPELMFMGKQTLADALGN